MATVAPEPQVAPGVAEVPLTTPQPTGTVVGDYSGLMNLSQEFLIAQTRKGCFQECCGCEANSQFKFYVNGQHTAMIEEQSSCMMRFCCGNARPWQTKMALGQSDDLTNLASIVNFERPFRCKAGPCKCCCFQEVKTTDPSGALLGGIKEQFWCCVPKFTVYGPDQQPVYDVHQPTCCGGQCINLCAEGCCNCRIPFYFYPHGGADDQVLVATNATCAEGVDPPAKAQVCKIWRGLGTELFTDADSFELKAPDAADASTKANLIGVTLLLNQIFFEGAQGGQ